MQLDVQNRQPYAAGLGVSVVLISQSHEYAPPHEQTMLIRLKQAIHSIYTDTKIFQHETSCVIYTLFA